MDYDLKPLWHMILQVYSEIEEICQRHSLRYCVAYGTALGAVRHKGFIPWDDDFDIQMPRPDYERFLCCAEKELPDWLKLVSYRNSKDFRTIPFTKVQLVDRERLDRTCQASHLPIPDGIFVDVFALDGCPYPRNNALYRRMVRYVKKSRHMYRFRDLVQIPNLFKHPRTSIYLRVSMFFGALICYFSRDRMSDYEYLKSWEDEARLNDFDKNEWCGYYEPHSGGFPWIWPRDFFVTPKMMPFEDKMVPVPSDFDRYLRTKFGDYLRLPPSEQQVLNHGKVGDTSAYSPCRLGPTGL